MKKAIILTFAFLFIILFASCKANDNSDIPSDIEVAYLPAERQLFEDLEQVENNSSLIVEAVIKKNLGQEVSTHYDYEFQKELPGAGYTKWEIEVTKVYKGEVEAGDKLVLLQDYYIWEDPDSKKQLVTLTSLKPAVKNKKYLLFLLYDDHLEGYCAAGDYEGMFAIPTDEIKEKAAEGTLKQMDLDVYNYETLHYLVPIYCEVNHKYFN